MGSKGQSRFRHAFSIKSSVFHAGEIVGIPRTVFRGNSTTGPGQSRRHTGRKETGLIRGLSNKSPDTES